jgi:type IV pilus biogenesis protein CpaD/CtpE
MYLPATGAALQTSDYRMSTTFRDSVLGGVKTWLSGVEAAIKVTLPNANLTVWSRLTANFHNVNQLQMGNVVDTQRRRRDILIENYGSLVFP